jgi:uncharacterized SAM-binding protein YcdF (DUF218 family)
MNRGVDDIKLLINPLLIFLFLQIVIFYCLWQRHNGYERTLSLMLLCSTFVLSTLSMPFIGSALEASLQITTTVHQVVTPTYIFVLGGGYQLGRQMDDDLLIFESQRRVMQGVAVWKSFPTAHLVFSGASHEEGRNDTRHAELTRAMALTLGVPSTSIILETHSRNTREHPVEALQLPNISTTTPIGVVTSAWHMRRAQREFCRHFQHVALFPVPVNVQPFKWQDFVPVAGALDSNTTLLREWVGLLWYAIVHRLENQPAELTDCAV